MSLHLQHRQSLSFYMGELTSRVRLLNISILLLRGELFPLRATSISAFCGEPRIQLVFIGNKHETANCFLSELPWMAGAWITLFFIYFLSLHSNNSQLCASIFKHFPSSFGSVPSYLNVQRQLPNMEPVTSTVMLTTASVGNSPTRVKALTKVTTCVYWKQT